MTKPHYEFQQAFEKAARKAGLTIQTFQIQPSRRLDQMTRALKQFIAETEQAYRESKNSKLHFGKKVAHHNHFSTYLRRKEFSRCI